MLDVQDVECWMLDVECWMFRMLNVGCSGCWMFRMLDVGC